MAALLVWGRDAFVVIHDEVGWRGPLARSAAVAACVLGFSVATLIAASHWGTPGLDPGRTAAELVAILALSAGPIGYRDPFEWVPAALILLWSGGALTIAWQLFRPLSRPHGLPRRGCGRWPGTSSSPTAPTRSASSSCKPTSTTSSTADGRPSSATGSRRGPCSSPGTRSDPLDALPGLLRDLCGFAEARGLALGVVGASEEFAELAAGAGLASFYIGDEAIVELASFSLQGRAIRKVRQAVTRAQKAGFTVSLRAMESFRGMSWLLSRRCPAAGGGRNRSGASRWRSTASAAST